MGSTTSQRADSVVTSVRLTLAEHDALKRIAAAERRSLSSQIRTLIVERDEELRQAA